MKASKNRHHGMWRHNAKHCFNFTVLNALFLTLLWSGQAFAVCQTATITASTPTTDFVDNGDGTVTHTKTGLMWKRCSEGQTWDGTTCTGTAATYNWQAALSQGANSTFATYTDWRLPNIKELFSIVEEQCDSPSINTTIFPGTDSAWYASSSPLVDTAISYKIWGVMFFTRGQIQAGMNSWSYRVRLVRGGQ